MVAYADDVYRTIVEQANDMVFILVDGLIKYANRSALNRLGYEIGQLKGSKFVDYLATSVPGEYHQVYEKKLSLNSVINCPLLETSVRTKQGDILPVEINHSVVKHHNNSILLLALRDIAERKNSEAEIRALCFRDSLTGLFNRAYFEEELNRLDVPRQLPLSIIMGDVNGLKLVNDVYGHTAGDQLLINIAQLLKSVCREEEIITRWGGDEFIILLPKTNRQDAENVCRRIQQGSENVPHQPFNFSISFGVATKENPDVSINEVYEQAELAMYERKLKDGKEARRAVITSIVDNLAAKSQENKKHAQRMQKLARKVGEAIELSDFVVEQLVQLAKFHNIGKIAVPDYILAKPDILNDDEKLLLQRHPEIGYRIAIATPELVSIAEGILHHHEWWNGNGYPHQLKGEEIPLISRIISIIDVYDIMLNEQHFPLKQVITELKGSAGSQFDPDLVQLFIDIVLEE